MTTIFLFILFVGLTCFVILIATVAETLRRYQEWKVARYLRRQLREYDQSS